MAVDFNLLLEESTKATEANLARLPQGYAWPERLAVRPGSPEAITEGLLALLGKLHRGEYTPETYLKRVGHYLRSLASNLQKDKKYRFFAEAFSAFEVRVYNLPQEIRLSLADDFALLYLRFIRKNEILAGVRGRTCWKKVQLPSRSSPTEWVAIAYQMMPFLHLIGPEELDLVPTEFLGVLDYPRVVVPTPRSSIVDLLTEAYYNQRYTLPPTGVAVRFQDAGDILEMVIKQVDDFLVARVTTTYGETLAHLSLDLAHGFSFETALDVEDRLLNLLAEAYLDLVTAETVEAPPKKDLPSRLERRKTHPAPSFRYLPRVRRNDQRGKVGEVREPYRGPRRPPKLHPVVGHLRGARMTDKHYQALLDWKKETGLRVPWHVVLKDPTWGDRNDPPLERVQASGNTFVRPHFSPVSDEVVAQMPTFIKRALQNEIDMRAGAQKN